MEKPVSIFETDPRRVVRSYEYYLKRKGMEKEKKRRFGMKDRIDQIERKFFNSRKGE